MSHTATSNMARGSLTVAQCVLRTGSFFRQANPEKRLDALFEKMDADKDGKLDGSVVNWYPSGRKSMETHFTDGKQDGSWTSWHENGRRKGKGRYKADRPEGSSTHWYANGTKKEERRHATGKLTSATVWKPNGDPCVATNLQEGDGVLVTYRDNGSEWFRSSYERGAKIRD